LQQQQEKKGLNDGKIGLHGKYFSSGKWIKLFRQLDPAASSGPDKEKILFTCESVRGQEQNTIGDADGCPGTHTTHADQLVRSW
jgi:hypothetical protein